MREIRLRGFGGVGEFFGVLGAAFGGGPAGYLLASGPVPGDGEDRILVVFVWQLLVVAVKVTSRAVVSGSRCARGFPVSRLHRVRMPSDSCSMTSSEPSGRALRVLRGTDFARSLTRQARWAPVPENRRNRSMEKKPQSARFSIPGRKLPSSCRPGRCRRHSSRRSRR